MCSKTEFHSKASPASDTELTPDRQFASELGQRVHGIFDWTAYTATSTVGGRRENGRRNGIFDWTGYTAQCGSVLGTGDGTEEW